MVEQLPLSRGEAIIAGVARYQGRPCKITNHNGVRYKESGQCCQCKDAGQRVSREKGYSDHNRNKEQLPQAHKVNALWIMPK